MKKKKRREFELVMLDLIDHFCGFQWTVRFPNATNCLSMTTSTGNLLTTKRKTVKQ